MSPAIDSQNETTTARATAEATAEAALRPLLEDIAARGIKLGLDGDGLAVKAPRGALDEALRDRLTARKAEIVELLRRRAGKSDAEAAPLLVPAPEERHRPFPLGDIQQAYWVGRTAALDLGSVSCHAYQEFATTGLDLERVGAAWGHLVERHGMLRAIVLPDGQQQILEKVPPYRMPIHDLRDRAPKAAEKHLAELREEMSHQLFEPHRWPLFDLRGVLLPGGESRLFLSLDLMMIDLSSLLLLLEEWRRLYEDPATRLPELEISFRDYVLAEQRFRTSPAYRRSEAYWRARLDRLPPAPQLPVRALSAGARPRFTRRRGGLERERWQRLGRRARQHGVTASNLLAAAWAEVLAAWSAEPRRFTLNLTFFKRLPLHPQVGAILGDFTSTILLEVDRSQPRFSDRARALQRQLAADLDHAEMSGVRVLRELHRRRPEGGFATMPVVFTSTLVHRAVGDDGAGEPEGENAVNPRAQGRSWLGESVYAISQTPQVWLDHQVYESGGALAYCWDAVEDLFPEGVLDAMFAAYQDLLERLAGDGGVAGDDAAGDEMCEEAAAWWAAPRFDFLPPDQAERRAAVNATGPGIAPGADLESDLIAEDLLHTPFLRRARAAPDALAVIAPGRTLSYGELRQRAGGLARHLREAGAAGEVVGVALEKDWRQIVAVLAVLEAGGVYLPIDPALPERRQLYLQEHAGVRLLLTRAERLDDLPRASGVEILAVPSAAPASAAFAPLERVRRPEDLAYVIYTSGSTGQPKGVAIEHRAALNTVADVHRRFAVGAADRVLALSSLSFDLSVYDVFGLLGAGGTVVVPPAGAERDPACWAELLERHRVTLWNTVPGLANLLLEYLDGRAPAAGKGPGDLRLVLLSGDWIPLDQPERLHRHWPDARVISLGGATEAAIWSIHHEIEEVDSSWSSIPYGRPLAGQRFHVLDGDLEERPEHVPGDLFIAGAGLARNYHRDRRKTAMAFLPHPRPEAAGERLYRTGDLGRWLPGGKIEFLGRRDSQVKVGGHRIELGEIESHLAAHAGVKAAVAAAAGEPRGERRLMAWVEPVDGVSLEPGELRRFLAERLPAYMVPPRLAVIDAWPLSANGKVDRQALVRQHGGAAASVAYAAPEGELESTVASALAEILERSRIGVDDNFFELGASSVELVRLHGRLAERLGRPELEVVDLFRHPTVRALAAALGSRSASGAAADGGGAENENEKATAGVDRAVDRAAARRSARTRRRQERSRDGG